MATYKPDEHLIRQGEKEEMITVEAIGSLLISGEGGWKKKIVPPGTIVELPKSQADHVIKTGAAKLSHKKITKPKELKKMQKKHKAKKDKELKERVERIKKDNS